MNFEILEAIVESPTCMSSLGSSLDCIFVFVLINHENSASHSEVGGT